MQLESFQEYNNVRIREDNKQKMTFKLNREFFEFLVMYFGLYNLLVIFELIIDSIL